jgi:hypothetical protein
MDQWHKGVLTTSSWHKLEDVGVMADDVAMVAAGENSGAWPVALDFQELRTSSGLVAPGRGIVAIYAKSPAACLSVVGERYRATAPEEWRSLIKAAVAAGGKPTGAFSLRGGTRLLATFEIGASNGLRTNLLLVDALDGSMRLTGGFTSVRVVCANTLAMALRSDGAGMASLSHTASLETKVNILAEGITKSIASGNKVRDTYHQAEALKLSKDQAKDVFDALFPKAPEDADKAAKTKAENIRVDARKAMWSDVNNAGGTLATLWNAATYLVDRQADGSSRATRGGDLLDSLLFGSRGERVAEIQTIIEVVLRDGSTKAVTAQDAIGMGADPRQVGAKVIEDILG